MKKKLDYRVYLGGREASDFNVFGNTNYNYTVNFNHTGIPANDGRVTYIDPIPASQNNNNLIPTANSWLHRVLRSASIRFRFIRVGTL